MTYFSSIFHYVDFGIPLLFYLPVISMDVCLYKKKLTFFILFSLYFIHYYRSGLSGCENNVIELKTYGVHGLFLK